MSMILKVIRRYIKVISLSQSINYVTFIKSSSETKMVIRRSLSGIQNRSYCATSLNLERNVIAPPKHNYSNLVSDTNSTENSNKEINTLVY